MIHIALSLEFHNVSCISMCVYATIANHVHMMGENAVVSEFDCLALLLEHIHVHAHYDVHAYML